MNEEKSSFIKGINEQHPTAYHQLYNEYYKALVLYAINFLSSQQAAEDIVQDLFATMWEKKMRFLSLPSFRTYLYNSIRNASLNYLKHQNVVSLYPDESLTSWNKNKGIYPYNWIVARYARDIDRERYNIPAIPSTYLLDKNKKVIYKDAIIEAVESYLRHKYKL